MDDNSQSESLSPEPRPSLTFQSVTFSDGSTIEFDDDDIVVFVGPNNAGKSAALREMEAYLGLNKGGFIVSSATLKKSGDSKSLLRYLELNAQRSENARNTFYGGIGYNINMDHVAFFDSDHDRRPVASFFAKRLATETRIQDSNAAGAIALFRDPPTSPIHMLLMDEALTAQISDKFRQAFGVDLIPFRGGGGSFPLFVGEKPSLGGGKDELSREFIFSLQESCVQLDKQGDGMRSFATVLLYVIGAGNHSIQFLDEPEAFLHPPQARLLGRFIAESRRESSQLFIATHSTDMLDGLIEGSSAKVRIIRIRREGDINRVKELSRPQTLKVAKDTLTRFSRVFDGIFFEHVIICESDADCMFYHSLLSLPSIAGERRPDVLFIHSAGKHRMAKLVDTLRALGVPVSVIADIDVLSESNTLRNLVVSLGGDWNEIQSHWRAVSTSVQEVRPPLNASQIKELILKSVKDLGGVDDFPQETERAIKSIFKSKSPWAAIKQGGRSALPNGEPTIQYDKLAKKCANFGLWIVPVGEVEGFCRSVGLHGPGFVERVLDTKDIASDPELHEAREFIRSIWKMAKS